MSDSGFAAYLQAFAARLRQPARAPRPTGADARRLAVYAEIVANNIGSVLDRCFPVTRRTLGAVRWGRLQRGFFAECRAQTPYFHEIPLEFLNWALTSEGAGKPPWLCALLHYEWAELAVDVMAVADDDPGCFPVFDPLGGVPVFNPAMLLLAYDWPVHRIGPDYRPRKPCPVWLLVYRNANEEVKFVQLNAVAARLLVLLRLSSRTAGAALDELAGEMGAPDGQSLQGFARPLLDSLFAEGVILGSR